MPLHMTKIAFGVETVEALRARIEAHGSRAEPPHPHEAYHTTRYLPRRHEEMAGGSLFWIVNHTLVARAPLLGFARAEDGRWRIRMEPRLVAVRPLPRRAHQGWRYLADEDAPDDLGEGELVREGEAMPGRLVSELARLGLV